MQKSFYCIFMKSTEGLPIGNFVESIFSNIQNAAQTSPDTSASFMYAFNQNKEAVVGIYTSDNQTKIPSYLTMYINSLNNEAKMMGAIFDTLDKSSSAYDQSVFRDKVSKAVPFYIEVLNNVIGTDVNPNENKSSVATSEPTADLFGQGIESESISNFEQHKSEGIEPEIPVHPIENKPPMHVNKEVMLLEEILDKLNDVVTSIAVLNDKFNRLEDKVAASTNTPKTSTSISKEIENIGGIPEIPTYDDEPIEPEVTPQPQPKEEEEPATTTKPVTEETVANTPDEGLEVTTPSEASIYTPTKSAVPEQSENSPTPIINTNLTPDVQVNEKGAEDETGTESVEPTPSVEVPLTDLDKIKKLMEYSDGTESSMHNYIISNSHSLDKKDLELYCTFDFEESIKQNSLVKLDRVSSIKRQLETKLI